MVFGEIIEPKSRALIIDEDDLDELAEYKEVTYELEGSLQLPDSIETLIFIETQIALEYANSVEKQTEFVAKIKNEGAVIQKYNNIYLILFTGKNDKLVLGEIVEIFAPWIEKAKSVHAITTQAISSLQPASNYKNEIAVTKCLTNLENVPSKYCSILEVPNLIHGLGASVLTFCIHNNYKAALWVVYMDYLSLEYKSSEELLKLFKFLNIDVDTNLHMDVKSNLYT